MELQGGDRRGNTHTHTHTHTQLAEHVCVRLMEEDDGVISSDSLCRE